MCGKGLGDSERKEGGGERRRRGGGDIVWRSREGVQRRLNMPVRCAEKVTSNALFSFGYLIFRFFFGLNRSQKAGDDVALPVFVPAAIPPYSSLP